MLERPQSPQEVKVLQHMDRRIRNVLQVKHLKLVEKNEHVEPPRWGRHTQRHCRTQLDPSRLGCAARIYVEEVICWKLRFELNESILSHEFFATGKA